MTNKKAFSVFLFWVAVAFLCDVLLYVFAYNGWFPFENPNSDLAYQLAGEFFGVWIIEEVLSLDNLFMFYFIFSVFHTPGECRVRGLRWGIIGVILMRGAVILGGVTLIHRFEWVLYLFSTFLLWAAFKIFTHQEDIEKTEEEKIIELENNWLVRLASRFFQFDKKYHGNRFFVKSGRRYKPTLLMLVVLVIEGTDLPFAFDSLPAAFAISNNFWIIIIANILAVMGLRSIYFLVENMKERFAYLQQGIGILLAFAGIKIVLPDIGKIVHLFFGRMIPDIEKFIPSDFGYHVSLRWSIIFIIGVILLSICYTLWKTRGKTTRRTR